MKVSGSKQQMTLMMCSLCLVLCAILCLPQPSQAWRERSEDVIEKICGDDTMAAKHILLTYDTVHGSTAEIAERIADVLCEEGFRVELRMARGIRAVDAYDAVIVGSPIYDFYWLPWAQLFLRMHRLELSQKPVALFITCTFLTDEKDTPERRADAVRLYVEPLLKKLPGIEPISTGILSGAWSFEKLYPFEAIRMRLAGFEEGDYRNWDKIEAWAQEVAELLQKE